MENLIIDPTIRAEFPYECIYVGPNDGGTSLKPMWQWLWDNIGKIDDKWTYEYMRGVRPSSLVRCRFGFQTQEDATQFALTWL